MNRVILVGRIVADPVIRTLNNERQDHVSNFSIAVRDSIAHKDTFFINCVAWNNNFIQQYVKKGALVSIEGRLVVRSYTNKDGRNIRVTEVKVDNLRSLGSRNDDNTSSSNIDDLQINVPTQNDNTIESWSDNVSSQKVDAEQQYSEISIDDNNDPDVK